MYIVKQALISCN